MGTTTNSSPTNVKAWILLTLTVSSLAYQTIAQDFVQAGLATVAKYVVLIGGVVTAIALAYTEAIGGKSGGGGTTSTTTTSPSSGDPAGNLPIVNKRLTLAAAWTVGGPYRRNVNPPKAEQPHLGWVRSLVIATIIAAGTLVGAASCKEPVSPNVVQTALTVEGYVCVLTQLASGLLPSGAPLTIAAAIQNTCQADIPQSLTGEIVSIIDAFSGPAAADAGASDASAPAGAPKSTLPDIVITDPSTGLSRTVDRGKAATVLASLKPLKAGK
jgi:hypothetical protein